MAVRNWLTIHNQPENETGLVAMIDAILLGNPRRITPTPMTGAIEMRNMPRYQRDRVVAFLNEMTIVPVISEFGDLYGPDMTGQQAMVDIQLQISEGSREAQRIAGLLQRLGRRR